MWSIDSSMGIMEELLNISGVDIFELFLRKFSIVLLIFFLVDRSFVFFDFIGELFMFMVFIVGFV